MQGFCLSAMPFWFGIFWIYQHQFFHTIIVAVAPPAIPKAACLKDWGDVIGSGAVAIGGGRFSVTEGARHVNWGIGYCYKGGG